MSPKREFVEDYGLIMKPICYSESLIAINFDFGWMCKEVDRAMTSCLQRRIDPVFRIYDLDRFLFIGSGLCSALPSNSPSQEGLALR